MKIPKLKKKVAERSAILAKLEHAINLKEINGVTPMMKSKIYSTKKVPMIETLFGQLQELNKDISEAIQKVLQQEEAVNPMVRPPCGTSQSETQVDEDIDVLVNKAEGQELNISCSSGSWARVSMDGSVSAEDQQMSENAKEAATGSARTIMNLANNARNSALALLAGNDDGEPIGAGFVSFKSLRTTQAALQMIQYPEPFAMEVLEAPDPKGKYGMRKVDFIILQVLN